MKENKVNIYKLRRDTKRNIKVISKCLMQVARSRRDAIFKWVQMYYGQKLGERGKVWGLRFNYATLNVDVSWNYFEGVSVREFPQTLLWSDKPIAELELELNGLLARSEQGVIAREKAELERLKRKYEN